MRGFYILRALFCAVAAYMLNIPVAASENPKREFRGAWMHTVFQGQYKSQTTEENKQYIRQQLDRLKDAGINAIFFQVRPQSDAFYDSDIETWSIFLTDGGAAPKPFWDPLQFIIEEAHARGMELHAWLNPYRVTSSAKQSVPKGHIYYKHPERFVKYDQKVYFDPGYPQNQKYIENVVADIVTRYDVDGIHFDDYFYPYPVKNKDFPDSKSYAKYGAGKDRDDWRRDNVNKLIAGLSKKIKSIKSWVRFGVSPFGIWRNSSSDKRGSATDGLENYDDLYADVIVWAQNGWVDYLIPQLYWEREHPRASYDILVDWWNRNSHGRHIYIGQDVEVTMKTPDTDDPTQNSQLKSKIEMTRKAANIDGSCWWPAYSLTKNSGGIVDSLITDQHSTPALPPAYTWISDEIPESPYDLAIDAAKQLSWKSLPHANKISDCIKFIVYRFDNDLSFDLENPDNIVGITTANNINISEPGYYVVTALDRVNNESFPSESIYLE